MAIDEIHLSISHEKDYAIAFAVGETCKRGILHYVQDDMEHNCIQDDMEHNCVQDDMEYNCVQDSMEYNNVQDSIGYSCHSEAEGRRISYPAQATFHLPKRNSNSHKGNYGRIGIIAGSQGMIGSAYLASMAALRSGAGLVYNIVPKSLLEIFSIKLIEAIILPVEDNNTGYFTLNSLKDIENIIKDKDVLALGPGIGVDNERKELVKYILLNYKGPIVLDADGLNCISHNPSILSKRKGATVLTPHPGEMARLLNTSIDKIQQDRIEYSKNFSKEYDIILALKGYKTIVTNGEDLYINTTGNPGMATAGSGDVLTGIITSFIGQGLEPFKAAKLGVYIHGLAGDLVKIHKGEYGLIARDIVENIPKAIYTMSSHRPG
ncbi:MAG: NAD(P)H-hydrate dehydratase [Tissierellia bacterium]|nr:NAD(P)H-hydrate dehydratase [Tissierellia bacterium]